MLLLSCFIQLAYGILTGYLIDMKEYDENALENQQPDVTTVGLWQNNGEKLVVHAPYSIYWQAKWSCCIILWWQPAHTFNYYKHP